MIADMRDGLVLDVSAEVFSFDVRAETVVKALTGVTFDVLAVRIDVLADKAVGGGVDRLINVKVILLDVAEIDLEFALPVSSDVDVLADAWTEAVVNIGVSINVRVKMSIDSLVGVLVGPIVGTVPDFSVVVLLVGVDDKNVLTVTMTALEFTI